MIISKRTLLRGSRALLLLSGFVAATVHAQSQPALDSSPIASEGATVLFGHARFTVLTPQMIRMEWASDDHFEDHPSFIFVNRRLPVPAFKQVRTEGGIAIDTGSLQLSFHPGRGDSTFTAQNLSVTLHLDGKDVTWHPGMQDTGNLLGTTRTLDGTHGEAGLKEPVGMGILSRDGWSVVDDQGPLFDSANFSPEHATALTEPWAMERPQGDRSDLYFFGYGHDYKQAMGDYVRVAGRIPLPPRYAFGVWWSRYWAYSDSELRDLVHDFRENNVPLDVLVIDMDWHKTFGRTFPKDESGHQKGWTGYSWDPALFPDPTDFLEEVHHEGLKVTLNLHPASGVQPWEDAYLQFARNMGINPKSRQYVPFDITSRKYAFNYFDLLHHPLEHQGVDFWWLDWQQESTTKIAGVNPTWWLNYLHFTDQEQEGKRPLLFHRWGGLGNHRYEIGFSGDTFSTWSSLAFQPWFTATAANVGYAYWSHDIGGHIPGAVDPELMTRWVQFGIYSPILRTHTTKNADGERRLWAFPEPYSDIMRAGFQLRSRLQPYLYTESRRTFDTGVAFMRPLYYDSPEADEAYAAKGEYLFGSEMLVAPVVKAADPVSGLAAERIWLPKGSWVEQPTGKHLTGPVTLDRAYSLNEIPVFVKAGAIVPEQPAMLHTGEKPVDPLVLTVYPLDEGQVSSYTLYEDSGVAEEYVHNQGTTWTTLSAQQSGDTTTVSVAPVKGEYEGMLQSHGFEVRLPDDWPPASVEVNGSRLGFVQIDDAPGWHYDGNTLSTVIRVPSVSVHQAVTITIQRAVGSRGSRSKLDGFAGRMHRLREAYEALSKDYPSMRAVPDSVTVAMESGIRMSYHPESTASEVKAFRERYAAAVDDVAKLGRPEGDAPRNEAAAFRQKKHEAALVRAMAALEDGNKL